MTSMVVAGDPSDARVATFVHVDERSAPMETCHNDSPFDATRNPGPTDSI